MVRACGTNGREENTHRVWWGNLKKMYQLGDVYLDGKMILSEVL
jgi:hypothetical protein